jgi:hypothetical protein
MNRLWRRRQICLFLYQVWKTIITKKALLKYKLWSIYSLASDEEPVIPISSSDKRTLILTIYEIIKKIRYLVNVFSLCVGWKVLFFVLNLLQTDNSVILRLSSLSLRLSSLFTKRVGAASSSFHAVQAFEKSAFLDYLHLNILSAAASWYFRVPELWFHVSELGHVFQDDSLKIFATFWNMGLMMTVVMC